MDEVISMKPEGLITCTVGEIAASTRNALVGGPFGSNLVSADYVESGIPVNSWAKHGFWEMG